MENENKILFRFSKQVDKFFKKNIKIKEKFINNIYDYYHNNKEIDISSLEGYKHILRMRIGKYKVIFMVTKENITIITVLKVGSRGDVYKHL